MASLHPSRQELDALLRRRQGELRDEPYRRLLLAMGTRDKSGVLTLRRGPLEKEIVFEGGAVVECHSNIATESLGRFLVASGRIDEGQYHDSLSVAAARGITLEELLVERTILSQTDLTRSAQQNLGRKLLEPFHWTRGTWHLSYDLPRRIDVVHRVRVPQLIVTGILKVEPLEMIENALREAPDVPLGVTSTPPFDPSELRLNEEQQRVVARIRAGATLADLRGAAASEELDRFIFALLFLGLAVSREHVTHSGELSLDVAASVAQPVTPPAPALVTVATMEQLSVATPAGDAFDVLGVEASANAMEITRAFLRMAEQYLPARYPERQREKAQEVFLAAVRAYNELADPVRRQTLVDKRAPKREIAEATHPTPPPDLAPSKSRRAIIDPEELYRQGRAAAAAGKLRDALGYFEMAADCDVQNGTYAAEAAYCRYQLLISPAPVTVKALKNAIRIDPRCAVAHLYLGKIQESLGNHVEAQAYLGRASMLKGRSRF